MQPRENELFVLNKCRHFLHREGRGVPSQKVPCSCKYGIRISMVWQYEYAAQTLRYIVDEISLRLDLPRCCIAILLQSIGTLPTVTSQSSRRGCCWRELPYLFMAPGRLTQVQSFQSKSLCFYYHACPSTKSDQDQKLLPPAWIVWIF